MLTNDGQDAVEFANASTMNLGSAACDANQEPPTAVPQVWRRIENASGLDTVALAGKATN